VARSQHDKLSLRLHLPAPPDASTTSTSTKDEQRRDGFETAGALAPPPLRNGGGYACAECETVLSSGHDDHLRSCSKCGAIPPPQRPSGGSSAAGVLNDARLPDTSGIDVTVERTKLLDW